MKFLYFVLVAIVGLLPVYAEITTPIPSAEEINEQVIHSEDTSVSLGLTGGTLGVGVNISTAINDFISLRLNMNQLNYSTNDTSRYSSVLDAEKTYNLDTKGLLLDIYLWQLRVTGGVYLNNNSIDYVAKPEGSSAVVLNGVRYTTDKLTSINSQINFDNIAPYVGIGWGNHSAREGFSMTLDIGLMYHGNPNIDINIETNPNIDSTIKQQLFSNLEAEKKLQEDDLSDFPFYPVVMVGISYSF